MNSFVLSVIDLCKRSAVRSARQSLEETLALAELSDELGYRRFWVAEHHTEDSAQACPEVLVALLASRTSRIRVGSGGVLLRYYSPLKVAETFLALEALFPRRIDLGVCKGPGVTSTPIAEALVCGNTWELADDAFDQKVYELLSYQRHTNKPTGGSQPIALARPWGVAPPPVWVLGSGSKSMRLAATLGTPYSLALFFDQHQPYGPSLMREYRHQFALNSQQEQNVPHTSIAVSMICLEKESEAQQRNAELVQRGYWSSTIIGNRRQCAQRLQELAELYGTDEILVATWMEDYNERTNLYRWIADECHLSG